MICEKGVYFLLFSFFLFFPCPTFSSFSSLCQYQILLLALWNRKEWDFMDTTQRLYVLLYSDVCIDSVG